MEVRTSSRDTNQQGVFATKAYAVGDIIWEEETALLRLAPRNGDEEAALVSFLNATTTAAPANEKAKTAAPLSVVVAPTAKKAQANKSSSSTKTGTTLWDTIVVPSEVVEAYRGTFKGMVQAALCWIVLLHDKQHEEARESFLTLYAPSLDSPQTCEVAIVQVAQQALSYLTEYIHNDNEAHQTNQQQLLQNPSNSTILRVMLIWACNSFAQGRVYNEMSRFNHSCDPNAVVQSPDERDDASDHQRVVAASPIDAGEEICISYLGLLLYTERPVRRQHLAQTKHFDCACPRCSSGDDSASTLDLAASIPCLQCHVRIGRQLDEDTQYDDDQTVQYIAPKYNQGGISYSACPACHTQIDTSDKEYIKYLTAGEKVVQKVETFLSDYQLQQQNRDDREEEDDEEEVQDELLDEHIRMASSVLGAKHWTTNLLLLLQVDRTLQSIHGEMLMTQSDGDGHPDLDRIAATVDSLERIVSFVTGLQLHYHHGHVTGNVIIGLARALVALGDRQSQTYAAEWLDKIAKDYVQLFCSPGLQKVTEALRTAWHQTPQIAISKDIDVKPAAKKAKR